jgi:hypothetical protein
MMTGIGMPMTQSNMPRMMNLDPWDVIDASCAAMHGGSMAIRITDVFLQLHTNASQNRRAGCLIAVHRFEARIEQVAAVGE